jgi:TetR/AcrR family transcriptional regulator, tetracycline repressor protein
MNTPETRQRAPRGRGRPPRVSRSSIIDAARQIAPEQLSMQAVADRLGVDRSTINYHFADRDELFSIVAAATFGAEMAAYENPASPDWRDWVREYARAVHAALLKHPETAAYVRLSFGSDPAAFAPIEGLIAKLRDAGFGDLAVAQAVTFISGVVHITARNEISVAAGGHPQGVEVLDFLDQQPGDALPGMRSLVAIDPLSHAEHFEFALRMIVVGLESLVSGRS